MQTNKPLLVTGIHRSGSTWLANMLSLNKDVILIDEPFNIEKWAYKLGGLTNIYYTYVPNIDEDKARIAFQKVLDNKTRRVFSKRKVEHWLRFTRNKRKVIKDPISALSSEWLYSNFDMDILVLVRHPAAYVNSLQRMDWNFPFHHLIQQDKLMENELNDLRTDIESPPDDFIGQAALSWKCIYKVLSNYLERNEWAFRRHEDLALNPVQEIKRLYEIFDLRWNEEVESKIIEHTRATNPSSINSNKTHVLKRDSKDLATKWKKNLSVSQIERIKEVTFPICEQFYSDDDW